MNAPVETQPVLPANSQTSALILDPQAMQNMVAFADFMCKAVITVPKHLQGNSGDCLAVTMQAMQWGMNPFAVAQKTHLVNGNLGYEAQLVNAVIIARAPITGRPNFEWYGDWSKVNGKECKAHDIGVRVWVTIKGESEPRVHDVSFAQVGSVRNSPNWVNDPKQQIAYLATKKLARLHFPDVILGVYTEDELLDSTGSMGLPPKDVVQTQTDNRPVLTDKQAEAAIKKINNKQVDLQQIIDYYIISDEQLNYIKAQTEVLEHDPV